MKLSELLKDGTPAELHHRIVGDVIWEEHEPGMGFVLYFPGSYEPLLVDPTVLFDEEWEIRE